MLVFQDLLVLNHYYSIEYLIKYALNAHLARILGITEINGNILISCDFILIIHHIYLIQLF